jgi:hypothetical protein
VTAPDFRAKACHCRKLNPASKRFSHFGEAYNFLKSGRKGEPAKDGRPPAGVRSMSRLGREPISTTDRFWRAKRTSREAGFGKQQIATACPTANRKIASGDTNPRKRFGNYSGCNGLFVRGKPPRLSIGPVDHVAAEEYYAVRRSVGLYW